LFFHLNVELGTRNSERGILVNSEFQDQRSELSLFVVASPSWAMRVAGIARAFVDLSFQIFNSSAGEARSTKQAVHPARIQARNSEFRNSELS
jgi:hypothetical protein